VRIVAGVWRGRRLIAPAGDATRPTADRVRQALFDMLLHAPWGGTHVVAGARVLDVFAGTGAFGLEALSRGAAHATFIEQNRAALAALRANVAALRAEARCEVLAADALAVPRGAAAMLAFFDPPYHSRLLAPAIAALQRAGRLGGGALLIAESARDEPSPVTSAVLATRIYGAARLTVWREP
jgi:16S rRNA (guanine966-N2)-methyltransferase